jgi:hypothetical protein
MLAVTNTAASIVYSFFMWLDELFFNYFKRF